MKITKEKIELIQNYGISIGEAAFVYSLKFNEFVIRISNVSISKLSGLGLFKDGGLTEDGEELAILLSDEPQTSEIFKEEFEIFWKLYPGDDGSDIQVPTRKLKGNKKEAYEEYAKIRTEFKHEEVIKGLQNELNFRKGIPDRFKYMKNIVNWLRNKVFLNYSEETEYREIYGKEII